MNYLLRYEQRNDLLALMLFFAAAVLLVQGVAFALAAAPATARVSAAGSEPNSAASGLLATSSLNWAGYVATGGSYTSVSGSWVVPNVDTSANRSIAADATWVGIGGVTNLDLIQAGTQTVSDADGNAVYEPWIELIPGDSYSVPFNVHPGDRVTVSIDNEHDNFWSVSLRDETTGDSYRTELEHTSSLSSAEWIQEMPSSARGNYFIPLDNFGSVSFTGGSTVDHGVTKTIAQSGAHSLTMKSVLGETLAEASPLGDTGETFSVERSDTSSTVAYYRYRPRIYVTEF